MTEACIEYDLNWIKGRDYIEVTFPCGTKEKSLLKKMAAEGVPGVLITAENKDGSVVWHVPLGCVHFRRPIETRKLSDAEKERRGALLRELNARKMEKTNENGKKA